MTLRILKPETCTYFQMEKALQISATDVNSETARIRILCRQGDYKTRRSHPTEPVGSENRNLRRSLISGDYKTTAKDISRARSRFLRSRKRDKQIQMPAKSAEVPRCQASSRFLGLRIWRSPHPCIVLSFGRILSTARRPARRCGCAGALSALVYSTCRRFSAC